MLPHMKVYPLMQLDAQSSVENRNNNVLSECRVHAGLVGLLPASSVIVALLGHSLTIHI